MIGIAYLCRSEPEEHVATDIASAGQPFGAGSTREQAAEQLRELREIERALRWCVGMRERRPERQMAYFASIMGVPAEAVLAQQYRAGVLKPSYILVREDAVRRITLIVRGTHSFRDLFTSLTGASKPHHVADSNGVVLGYAHLGMLASARWLRDEVTGPMEAALADNPGYRPLLIGHSLGAGAAAMLCMMLRERPGALSQTTCIAIACPACMTAELARSCAGYVTTIVNGADVIPTVSPGSADALRASMNASTWAADLRKDVRRFGVVRGIEASVRATASAAIRARAWTGERLAGCVPPARACRVRRRSNARGRSVGGARSQARADRDRCEGNAAPADAADADGASDGAADGDLSSDAPRVSRTGNSLSRRRAASAASAPPPQELTDASDPATPSVEGSTGARPRPRLAGLRMSLERRSAALATWWTRRRASAVSDSANDDAWSSDDEGGDDDLGRSASDDAREEALGEIAAAAGMLEEEEEEEGTGMEEEVEEGEEDEEEGEYDEGGYVQGDERETDSESPRRSRTRRDASSRDRRGLSAPDSRTRLERTSPQRAGGESPLVPPPLSPEPERGSSAQSRRRRSLAEDIREVRRAARVAERFNSEERPVVPSVIALGDYGRSARGGLSPAQQDARWRRTMYPAGRIIHLVPASLVPFAEGTWDHVSRHEADEPLRTPPAKAAATPVVDGDVAAATRAAEAEEAFITEALGEGAHSTARGDESTDAVTPQRMRATPFSDDVLPCGGGETPAFPQAPPESDLLSTPSQRPSRLASLSSALSAAMRTRRRERRAAVPPPREPHLLLDHVPQTAYGRMKLCRGVLLDHIIPSYLASMETAYANLPSVFQDLMREEREAEVAARAAEHPSAPPAHGSGDSSGPSTADPDGYIRAEVSRRTYVLNPAALGASKPSSRARSASPVRRPNDVSRSRSPSGVRLTSAITGSATATRSASATAGAIDPMSSPERAHGLTRLLSGPGGLYSSKRPKVKEEDEPLSEGNVRAVGGARERAAQAVQQRRAAVNASADAKVAASATEDPRASINAAQCAAAASMVL